MTTRVEHERAKRQLRVRIGRMRRRIDGRIRSARRAGLRLVSWRTYVRRYPAHAVLGAFGIGLAGAAGLRPGRWWRLLARQLVRRGIDKLIAGLWRELKAIWAESGPPPASPQSRGAEDAGS